MGDNFGLESNTNLTFIEFDDQQIANIGAALQAVADQMVPPNLAQQLLNNYEVDGGSSYVEDTKLKAETTSASIDSTNVSLPRSDDKTVIKAEISNQLLLESSNDLSSYLTKEEPQLQEFEIDPLAPDYEVDSINMQYFSDEGSELSTDCGNEILVGGDRIDSIESDSQDDDDNEKVKQQSASINYMSFIRHICPECGVDCGPYSKWKQHTDTQHKINWLSFISKTNLDGESCYQCHECKKKLSKKSNFRLLQEHHIKHLPHSSYLKCQFCEKKYSALYIFYRHIKREHAKLIGPYLNNKHSNPNFKYIKIFCPICHKSQTNMKLWQQHLTEKHDYENKIKSQVTQIDRNLYSCNLCHKSLKKSSDRCLKIHMLTHEPNKSFQCILCKLNTTQITAAINHMKLKHSDIYRQIYLHECGYCEATFAKKFLLLKHHKDSHQNEILKHTYVPNSLNQLDCNPVQCNTKNDLSTHNTLTIENYPYGTNAETTSANKEDLSHSNERRSQNISDEESGLSRDCSYDSIVSDSQDDDDENYDRTPVTESKKSFVFICPQCDLECGSRSEWKLHTEKQHQIVWFNFNSVTNKIGESFYQCPDCNRMLSQKMELNQLQEHRMQHMPYSSYLKCRFCDKRFQTRSNVYPHMEREHPQLSRPYLKKINSNPIFKYIKIFCPICRQAQTTVKHWWQHLKENHNYVKKAESQATQVDKRMYSCNICDRKICQRYIKDHMLLHEPNKSFQCVLCKSYQFLERSVVLHVNEKHLSNSVKMKPTRQTKEYTNGPHSTRSGRKY